MIHKLKHKIFIGILLLAILLAASGSMVLYQFLVLRESVGALIEDNYKTIQACQKMLDALEREDSGILLLSLGEWEEGRTIIDEADVVFMEAFRIAEENLTETNEHLYVNSVLTNYKAFKEKWRKPIVGTQKEGNIQWYINEINGPFLDTKESVYALMNLNQESMYGEAYSLEEQSYRTIMPGIIAIGAIILFAFTFNFFLSQSFLVPLRKLTESTRNFRVNLQNFNPKLKGEDEFKKLEHEIRELIQRINQFHQKP